MTDITSHERAIRLIAELSAQHAAESQQRLNLERIRTHDEGLGEPRG